MTDACEDNTTNLKIEYPVGDSGFCRFEVVRSLYPGLPEMPLMISNPIYFE
jgi:hypothetical protein